MACSGCRRRCYWLAEHLDLTCERVRGALYAGLALGAVMAAGWLVGR